MNRSDIKGIVPILSGAGLVVGVGLAGAAYLNGSDGFEFCVASTPFGWAATMLAGLVLLVVSVALVRSAGKGMRSVDDVAQTADCMACGSPIVEGWRICPHCGALLECEVRVPTHREAVDVPQA